MYIVRVLTTRCRHHCVCRYFPVSEEWLHNHGYNDRTNADGHPVYECQACGFMVYPATRRRCQGHLERCPGVYAGKGNTNQPGQGLSEGGAAIPTSRTLSGGGPSGEQQCTLSPPMRQQSSGTDLGGIFNGTNETGAGHDEVADEGAGEVALLVF